MALCSKSTDGWRQRENSGGDSRVCPAAWAAQRHARNSVGRSSWREEDRWLQRTSDRRYTRESRRRREELDDRHQVLNHTIPDIDYVSGGAEEIVRAPSGRHLAWITTICEILALVAVLDDDRPPCSIEEFCIPTHRAALSVAAVHHERGGGGQHTHSVMFLWAPHESILTPSKPRANVKLTSPS